MFGIMTRLLVRFATFRNELATLWRAFMAPETPWHLKALMLVVPAYLLSPIDLIPDAIPVLGWLDDLLLVPFLLWLALRLTPPAVLEECRRRAAEGPARPDLPFCMMKNIS